MTSSYDEIDTDEDIDDSKYDFSAFIKNGKIDMEKVAECTVDDPNKENQTPVQEDTRAEEPKNVETKTASKTATTADELAIGSIGATITTPSHTAQQIDPNLLSNQNLHQFSKVLHQKQAEMKAEKERIRIEKEEIENATSMQKELEYLNQKEKVFKTLPSGAIEEVVEEKTEEVEGFIDFDNIDLSEVEIKLRILLKGHKEVVHIIGDKGETITNIRTVSEARVKIDNPEDYERLKNEASESMIELAFLRKCSERILTISGNQDQINTALELVTAAIDLGKNKMVGKKRTNNPVVLKLIFPTHMCGVILGKGGNSAAKLREETGAKLEIDNELLPNSTERLIKCAGDAEQCADVVQKIVDLLLMSTIQRAKKNQEYQLKGHKPPKEIETTPYEPRIDPKYLKKSKKSEKKSKRDEAHDEKMAALQMAYQIAKNNGIPPPTGRGLETSIMGFNKTLIKVAEINIGAIIGPNGSRIKRIRSLSGAYVKICDPIEDELKRNIEISGSTPNDFSKSINQVSMAGYLINCCNDLYGNTTSGRMNNPFSKNSDGSFKTQLGDWLMTTNTTPEEQLVLKSFFMDFEQKQNFETEGYNEFHASKSGLGQHQSNPNSDQPSSSKFLPGMKGYGFDNFKRPKPPGPPHRAKFNKNYYSNQDSNKRTNEEAQLELQDYLEKTKRPRKSKKSKKAKRQKEENRVEELKRQNQNRSNKEILEDLMNEAAAVQGSSSSNLHENEEGHEGYLDIDEGEVNDEISNIRWGSTSKSSSSSKKSSAGFGQKNDLKPYLDMEEGDSIPKSTSKKLSTGNTVNEGVIPGDAPRRPTYIEEIDEMFG